MQHRDLDTAESTRSADLHVVLILNFLSPDIAAICRAWQSRVKRLDVVVSVPVEANRHWTRSELEGNAEQASLKPITQRTWTWTRRETHDSFTDMNYVHIPIDTLPVLWRLRPDVIVASELGARSLQAAVYKRLHRRTKLVLSVSTTEQLEQSRNRGLRRRLRRWLISQADAVTYHGESCRRFCEQLGAADHQLRLWNYAADPEKIYRGPILDPSPSNVLRFITVGQLIGRKGIEPTTHELVQWCQTHPDRNVSWTVVGTGPLENWLRSLKTPSNLAIDLQGHRTAAELRSVYQQHELLLFPTLGDEWGLVVDEAMMSGLVCIGSRYAQSSQTLIHGADSGPLQNGVSYDPLIPGELSAKLDWWDGLSAAARLQMRQRARHDSVSRTPDLSASQITAACTEVANRHNYH